MSSVKCIGAMAAAGALVSGGYSLYRGSKARKQVISNAETIAKSNHGQIPTGGMTKDGKMWDGYTTVDKVKKDTAKGLAQGVGIYSRRVFACRYEKAVYHNPAYYGKGF